MVSYQIALILRAAGRPDLVKSLKRVCTTILQEGNIIKKLENLGERKLPYKIIKNHEKFLLGRYFVLDIEAPPYSVLPLKEKIGEDSDVIRATLFKPES